MTTNNKRHLDRRDFNRLSAAALGGMLGGAALGCGQTKTDVAASGDAAGGEAAKGEWHLCRGLNECKGQGKGGDNDCAGAGTCATLEPHGCGHQNECKGQGGCGKEVGTNECKGKGGCAMPLMEGAWDGAREKFEAHMKEEGKEVKPAPEPKA